jgi:chitodextrinase
MTSLKSYRRFLVPLLLSAFAAGMSSFFVPQSARAAVGNLYIADVAAGNGSGSSCANAKAKSFLDSATNWGTGATQIGPGTTVHACGTITTAVQFKGSGTAGSPITFLFEPNAKFSKPSLNGVWISINGFSYVIVDGGVNGIIETTDTGTSLGSQQGNSAFQIVDSSNIEIKNLTIRNLFVITPHTTTFNGTTSYGIVLSTSSAGTMTNITIHNNKISQAHFGISLTAGPNVSSVNIYDNDIFDVMQAMGLSDSSAISSVNGLNIYNNKVHDGGSWDSLPSFYVSGIGVYPMYGGTFTNVKIYNNSIYGDFGNPNRLASLLNLYAQNGSTMSGLQAYNNVLSTSSGGSAYGYIYLEAPNAEVYNNTFAYVNTQPTLGIYIRSNGAKIKNNLFFVPYGIVLGDGAGSYSLSASDFNMFYPSGQNFDNGTWKTVSAWKTGGRDTNSFEASPAFMDAGTGDFSLSSGSPAINAGANLGSIFSTDRNGILRPQGAGWDIGAYEYNGALDLSAPTVPTGLAASNITATEITLSWGASTDNVGVTNYTVYRNGSPITTTNSLSYTDTSLSPQVGYSYTVRANDGSGNSSAQSSVVNATTLRAFTLTVTKTGTGSGTVVGGGVPGINCGSTCTALITDGAAVSLGASSGAGSSHAPPYWSAPCAGIAGTCTFTMTADTTVSAHFSDISPPTVPIGLASLNVTSSGATISWSAATDNVAVTDYRLYRDGALIATLAGTSYTDFTLLPSTAYVYTVSARDSDGNTSAQSAGLTVTTSAASATPPKTYYIDFANGSNTNNGLTKATAWKLAPGMAGFTGTYTHEQGDKFIFKGGVTWPASVFPLQISAGGSAGRGNDYYGVDDTWFAGASFTRPIFDGEYTAPRLISLNTTNYLTIDNIELKRVSSSASAGYGLITGSNNNYILISNAYLHGWRTSAANDGAHGGVILSYTTPSWASVVMDNCDVDNAENSGALQNGTATYKVQTIKNSRIHDVPSGILYAGNVSGNNIYNISYPVNNQSYEAAYQTTVVQLSGAGLTSVSFNHNKVHDYGSFAYPVTTNIAGLSVYVYDNLIYGNQSSRFAGRIDTFNGVGSGSGGVTGFAVIFNNTVVNFNSNAPAIEVVNPDADRPKLAVINAFNNLVIGDGATLTNAVQGTHAQILSAATNLILTAAQAASAAFTAGNLYRPTLISSPTIDAGTTVVCATCLNATIDMDGNIRPQGVNWDIGAYEGVSQASIIPSNRLADWTPGVTVGVPGGIPTDRTNIINVTQTPYNADKTGVADAQPAIQAAINAAPPNSVVYLPAGTYLLNSGINAGFNKDNITIRGEGPSTILDLRNGTISIGSDGGWNAPGASITGSPTKGATVLNVSDTTFPGFANGGVGTLANIVLENDVNLPVIHVSHYGGQRHFITRVVAKTASTITVSPAIPFDLPASLSPKLYLTEFHTDFTGVEDLTINMGGGNAAFGVTFDQAWGAWAKNIWINKTSNYHIFVLNSLQCEIRHSDFRDRKIAGTNGGGILFNSGSFCLVEDNIIANIFPELEINFASTGNVFAYNFAEGNDIYGMMGAAIDSNHGPHNSYNLYEGNVASIFQSDGYFGGESEATVFRNWIHGTNATSTMFRPALNLNRFSRNFNIVGNQIGKTGTTFTYENATAGIPGGTNYNTHYIYSFGLPNIGNGGYDGSTAQLSMGTPWKDFELGSGRSTVRGTLTTRTNNSTGIVTLTTGPGNIFATQTATIWWTGGVTNVDVTAVSSTTISVSIPPYLTATLPAAGSAIDIYGGPTAYQELDLDVKATTLLKGNWNPIYNGIPTAESLGGNTLPNSLYLSSKPLWFGTLAWPAFGPDVKNEDYKAIPAGYRYELGIDPPSGASADTTPPSVTNVTLSTSNVTGNSALVSWTTNATDNVSVVGYQLYRNGVAIPGAVTTPYLDNALSATTNYTYTVKARDAAGNFSPPSASKSITTGTASYSLSISKVGTGSGTISCGAIDCSSPPVVLAGGTAVTLTATASIGSTFVSWHSACNGLGSCNVTMSADQNVVAQFDLIADSTAPSVPAGLASSNITATGVKIDWTASTDDVVVSGYEVYRDGVKIASPTTNTYTDSGLTAGTNYSYKVSAVDAAGNQSAQSSALTITTSAAGAGGIYLAQAAVGSGDGSSCANARAVSYFNSAANWGAGSTQIGPGKIVHLCGTISTALTAQGSGATGNVITILFEDNAKISLPACPGNPNGCLTLNNKSYIVVDGGTNGIIEATDSGTGLTYRSGGTAIVATPCDQCEFKNLTIQNIYKRALTSDPYPADGSTEVGIAFSGTGIKVHHNVLHDMGWALINGNSNGNGNVRIYNNDIYNIDHGYTLGGTGSITASGFYFYNNHVHDYANWDSPGCRYHHDGIHAFGTPPGGPWPLLTDLRIYNNLFDGDVGACPTSHIFLEGGSGSFATPWTTATGKALIFNNTLIANRGINGILQVNKGSNHEIYNNTIIGADSLNGIVLAVDGTNVKIKNNVLSGGNALINGTFTLANAATDLDYNFYTNCTSYNCWFALNADTASFATWRAQNGGADSNSLEAISSLGGISPSGALTLGSPAIAQGVNLTSLAIPELNSDRNGVLRSASSAWDMGATIYTAGDTTAPSVPLGLASSNVTSSGVKLDWSASTDNVAVTGYKVYRDGVLVASPTTNTYTDSGLVGGTTYSYKVSAQDAAGNSSAQSTALPVTTLTATAVPFTLTVTNLGVYPFTVVSTDIYTLTGTVIAPGGGSDSFYIDIDSDPAGDNDRAWHLGITPIPQDQLVSWPASNPKTFNLNAGPHTLYVRLREVGAEVQKIVFTPRPDLIAPSVPTNLAPSNVTATSVKVDWAASTDDVGVSSYKVYRDGVLIASPATNTYTDTGLTLGTTYTYTVSAQDAAGNSSAQSTALSVTIDTVAPTVPTGLSSSNVTSNSVTLNWTASTDNLGVRGYKVYRDGALIASPTGATYVDTGLTSETTYSYAVAAEDSAGNMSAQSGVVSVTTPVPPTAFITNVLPKGALPASTTQTTLSLKTHVPATCMYSLYGGSAFNLAKQTFTTTGARDHSTVVAGLIDGHSYKYFVRCTDGGINTNEWDQIVSFHVGRWVPPAGVLDPRDYFGGFDPIESPNPDPLTYCPNWSSNAQNSRATGQAQDCYYVDNTGNSGTCSDSNAGGYGDPDSPLCSIPRSRLAEGSYVEVHGDGGTGIYKYIQFSPKGIGSAVNPIWYVGINKPIISGAIDIGEWVSEPIIKYIVLDGFFLQADQYGSGVDIRPRSDNHHFDHIVLRNMEANGMKKFGGFVAGATSPSTPTRTVSDVVVYNAHIYNNGDPAAPGEEIGIYPVANLTRYWILDSAVHHIAEDGFGGGHGVKRSTDYYMIGRNHIYDNITNAIDIKHIEKTVISENTIYGHHNGPTSTGDGESIGLHYAETSTPGPDEPDVWKNWPGDVSVLFNHIFDGEKAIVISTMDRLRIVGNVIHGMHHSTLAPSWNPASAYSDGVAIHMRGKLDNAYIVNNTLYDNDSGIQDPDGYIPYSATQRYYRGNAISYNNVNYALINDDNNAGVIGIPPTNTSYWKKFSFQIWGNIISNRSQAAGRDLFISELASGLYAYTMDYNLFYNPSGPINISFASSATQDLNAFVAATPLCDNCTTTNPAFASSSDLSLQPASPAVNGSTEGPAGNSVYDDFFAVYGLDIRRDIRGIMRPQGGGWDMGAYEFGAPSTDTTAPSVPTGLASSNITASGVKLNWTASTDNVGVTSYDVYRNGTKVGSPTSNMYTDAGLTAGTTYSYKVLAKDAASNSSALSSVLLVTTLSAGASANNLTEPGEACDGADLNSMTCLSAGFKSGTLSCKSDRSGFDVSQCVAPATVTATTCSRADVLTAITQAAIGDTVIVPAGNCTWSSAIEVSKAVSIIGAGSGAGGTKLTATGSLPDGFFYIHDVASSALMRISGFYFDLVDWTPPFALKMFRNNALDHVRIDHNTFNQGGVAQIEINGSKGVIDNNYFHNGNKAVSFSAGSRAQADASWASMIPGTGDALFIEDNNFVDDAGYIGPYGQEKIGTYNGGKLVIRNNNFDATAYPLVDPRDGTVLTFTPFMAHGSACGGCNAQSKGYWETAGSDARRGQSIIEVYDNKMSGKRIDFPVAVRGSSNLIYNNAFTISTTWQNYIALAEEEYGASNGWVPERTNWPAEDQVHNTFIWNNTRNGVQLNASNISITPDPSKIQLDRDYFLHAPQATGGREVFICKDGVTQCNGASSSAPTDDATYQTLGTMAFVSNAPNAYYPYSAYAYPHPLTKVALDTTVPSVPAGLLSSNITQTSVKLDWTASTDNVAVTGYKVYRGGTLVASPATNTFTDAALTAGTNYSYKISAADAAGNVSAQSTALSINTLAAAGTADTPAVVGAKGITPTQININWSPSLGINEPSTYNVYRNGVLAGSVPAVPNNQTYKDPSLFQDTGLTPGTAYTYTVKAVNAIGESAASMSVVATTLPAGPNTVIPPQRLATWTKGVTVGVKGGIPTRTTLIDVTAAPYNADKTGATDSVAAINAAITAASSNSVVYFPAGTYRINSAITVQKSNITLRGAGMNSTIIDCRGTGCIVFRGGDGFYNAPQFPITAGLTKGSTQITVSNASTISIGQLLKIVSDNDMTVPEISVTGYQNVRQQNAVVTAKTGNTLTIDPPLMHNSYGANPKVYLGQIVLKSTGLEDMTVDATNGTAQTGVALNGNYNTWVKNVKTMGVRNYNMSVSDSLFVEMGHNYLDGGVIVATNHAGLLLATTTGTLFEDNTVTNAFPLLEINFGSAGNVFAYNFMVGNTVDTNHAPHNTFNLYEGNITESIMSDGYFGGESEATFFRNWFRGGGTYLKRWSRNFNIVGNVMGKNGGANGTYSFGQPNIGNGSSNGFVAPSGGVYWTDWSLVTGLGIKGTLTSRTSNSDGQITISSGDSRLIEYCRFFTGGNCLALGLEWSGGLRNGVTQTARTGSVITIAAGTGTNLPAVGTVIGIWPRAEGFQEMDLDVGATTLLKKNFYAGTAGYFRGVNESLETGQTMPNSLYLPGKPSWFGTLAWPPVDSDVAAFDNDAIPAGYRYSHAGVDPPSGVVDTTAPSSPTGLVSSNITATGVKLDWTAATDDVGVAGYRVYRGASLVASPATNSYTDSDLTGGTLYSYKVSAVDAAGNESAQSSAVTVTTLVSTQNLSVTTSGTGTVTSNPAGINCGTTCSAAFASGSSVTLTATPGSGFTFNSWSGACSGSGACTLTMSAARSVNATFNAIVVNTPPTTQNISVSTNQDTNANFTLSANDANGDFLTYTVMAGPSKGTLMGVEPNLTYVPNTGYFGSDSFSYKVNDGTIDSNISTVTINIAQVITNSPPIALSQNVTTNKGTAKSITLSATDANSDPLTYALVSSPVHGALSGTAPNLTYTPTSTYTGPDSFTFKANDGITDSGPATISITVLQVNQAPVATSQSVTTAEDTAKTITLAGTDVDNDPLSYSIVTSPLHGTLTGTAPNLTYTPTANYNGPDSFTFRVNDGTVNSAAATVNITVTSVNDMPMATGQSVSVTEDTAKTITLAGTDVEGSPLTYTVVAAPSHGALSGTAPNLTYTPTANYNGPDSFTFKVNDGTVDSSAAVVTITITNVNDAPIATSQSVAVIEDVSKAIVLAGTDGDGNPLTYTVVTAPAKGTLSGTAPNLTYAPSANYTGPDSFTFRVNDGTVNSSAATVTITVSGVNDAPVASNQTVAVTEDVAKALVLVGSDVDGDPLTYTIVAAPTKGTLSGTAPNLTYTPAADYTGADSFTFRVNDGTVNSSTATVTIAVTGTNDAPVAASQSVSAVEDANKTIALSATDGDGDPLTYSIVTNPAHGSLSGTAPNVTYIPTGNYNGPDSFSFRANDGLTNSNTAAVTITVASVNDSPVSGNQTVAAVEDTAKVITLAGSDVDGDPLTFNIVSAPTKGTLTGIGAVHTYTPTANYSGSDSFTYRVNDGTVNSATATVTINIAPFNDVPIADAQSVSTPEDTDKAIILTGSDVESATLTYSIVTNPSNGTLSGIAPNITYSPNANFNGSDSFSFRVNDGSADSVTAVVSITVSPVNDSPVAANQSVTAIEDTAKTITLVGNDVDGNPLTYTVVAMPTKGTLTGTAPNVTYTPAADYTGGDSFTFRVNDGTVNSSTATVSITVVPANDAPIAVGQSVTAVEDTDKPITLNASDIDGDPLTYVIVANPAKGTLAGTGANVTYSPNVNYNGTDSFKFRVNDGLSDSAIVTVNITITAVNDAPVADNQVVGTPEDTAKTFTLTGSDVDGDPITFEVLTAVTNGAVTGTAPNLTYTPTPGYHGPDSMTFRVKDGAVNSSAATISFNVQDVNDPPTADSQSVSTDEDTDKVITLTGSDPDLDTLAFVITVPPTHGVMNGSGSTVTYSPEANYFGPDSFSFKVNDGGMDSPDAVVAITVNPIADAPVALPQSVSATEDASKSIVLAGTDAEGAALTYTVVANPSRGSLSGTAPNLTYTPDTGFFGIDNFTFKVNDGGLDSTTATITINVAHVNHAPVAAPQTVTASEDIAQPIVLAGTDVDSGDVLTYSIVNNPAKGTLSGTAPNLTYTPSSNYNGADSFTFKVDDGLADSSTVTVAITIGAANDSPTADDQTVAVTEDIAKAITLVAADIDGGTLSYVIDSTPLHGVLSGTAPNLTYTSNTGYFGPDSFSFKVNDGTVDSSVAVVNINIAHVNHPPTAVLQNIAATEDLSIPVTLSGIDADSIDTLTYTVTSGPAKGTLSGTAPNFTYTPSPDYFGNDTITFKVNDGTVDSLPAVITIVVAGVSDVPSAPNQGVNTLEDTAKPFTLNAVDMDGDPLTYTILTNPANGSLSGTAPNLTYTPNPSYFGNDTFTYKVNDGTADSSTATVSIIVTHVNHPPVATGQSITTDEDISKALTLVATDSDAIDTLSYPIATPPANGTILGTGKDITYKPRANFNGNDSFTFRAFDGTAYSNVVTVNVAVTAVDDPPVAQPQSVQGLENSTKAITLTAIEVDGDPLTYTIINQPNNGTLTGSGKDFIYRPKTDFNGVDTLSFKVNDGITDSSEATITITVLANQPPIANNLDTRTNTGAAKKITLGATDPDGDVMSYKIVTQPKNGTLTGSSNTYTYQPNNGFIGKDTFTFKANDNSADSNEATITVDVVPLPLIQPTITSPIEGATFLAGRPITISAVISGNVTRLTRLEFFDGNIKIGEDRAQPFNLVWRNPGEGTHVLTTRATMQGGQSFEGAPVTITVLGRSSVLTPPVLTSPEPGSLLTTSTITLEWTPGMAVEEYFVRVGTTSQNGNLFMGSVGTKTSVSIDRLPLSGRPIYARLWWKALGRWKYKDYIYTTQR